MFNLLLGQAELLLTVTERWLGAFLLKENMVHPLGASRVVNHEQDAV